MMGRYFCFMLTPLSPLFDVSAFPCNKHAQAVPIVHKRRVPYDSPSAIQLHGISSKRIHLIGVQLLPSEKNVAVTHSEYGQIILGMLFGGRRRSADEPENSYAKTLSYSQG